ncbi:MAG: DNA repair protein RecO [Pseudomonadota bacterium]
MADARVRLEPAWVLHRRDYRDSSQIVDLMTAGFGRVSMVARGIKRPKSPHRGLLQPFRPLLVSWVGRRDLVTMSDVERAPGAVLSMHGDNLLSAFYVNELLLRLTHRFDPQPELFAVYGEALQKLSKAQAPHAPLRDFESDLLDVLGVGIPWGHDYEGVAIDPQRYYRFSPERGFETTVAVAGNRAAINGQIILAMAARQWSDEAVLTAARQVLTQAIDWHLGERPLQTREVLKAMRRDRGNQ